MTTTTRPALHWTKGRNGNTWHGFPARVFVAPDADGYNLFVDGVLSGTFGSMQAAQVYAEDRYAGVLAATKGNKQPLSSLLNKG